MPDETSNVSESILRFGAFVLDGDRALLTRSGVAVALRPKVFTLLSYLARHPGRVLGKRELLAAVWPGVVVNDESLSQCVRELRAALGDDAQALIKTLPRRGYLFDAAAAAPASDSAAPPRRRAARLGWLALGAGVAALLVIAAVLLDARRGVDVAPVDASARWIAVLPFAEAGDGLFGDAVAEDLGASIAWLPGTRVVGHASAAVVAARSGADLKRAARELGVRHLLTGSVQREGASLRVAAQLVAADDGALLWSDRFDYPDIGAWDWRRQVGEAVARSFGLAPGPAAAFVIEWRGRRLEAVVATLQGRRQLRSVASVADLRRARALFEQALALEPDSASALVGLARSHLNEVEHGWSTDRAAQLASAERALARAGQLTHDPSAYSARVGVLSERGDLEAALGGYQIGVSHNPSAAWAHARIAMLKMRLGRPEEVALHADTAVQLSPHEPALVGYSHWWAGVAEFYVGREDAAHERLRRAADAGSPLWRMRALPWLAALDALQGRGPAAARYSAEVMRLEPGFTIAGWRQASALTHARLATGGERVAEGMRRAGLPQ